MRRVAGLLLARGDGGVLFSKTQVPDLAAQRLFNVEYSEQWKSALPEEPCVARCQQVVWLAGHRALLVLCVCVSVVCVCAWL